MSSSEDEIMEISNLPSSSNNYVSKSSETVPVDKAISLPPKTTNTIIAKISSPSASRINKRYQSKFKKEWLSNSYFSTFLRECKTDQTKAVCVTCNIQFSILNSGVGDINHHVQTKKHQDRTKSAEANPSNRIYSTFNITTTELNKLCAVEVEWKFIQQCSTFVANQTIDLDDLYNDFTHIKSKYIDLKERFGGITTQVQSFIVSNLGQSKYNGAAVKNRTNLCNDCDLKDNLDDSDTNDDKPDAEIYKDKKTNKSIRPDHLWAYLLDGEHVPNLRKLIEFVFAIPASNSFCESVFSHMNFLWNNNRNKMKHDLVGAELKIKMNTHLTCTEFYDYLLTKPDILKKIRSSEKYSHIAKVP
ncbi:unnamed protein product [Rotaria socialis]